MFWRLIFCQLFCLQLFSPILIITYIDVSGVCVCVCVCVCVSVRTAVVIA